MTTFLTPETLLVTVVDPIRDDGTFKYKVCIANPARPNVSLTQLYRRFSEFEPVFKRLVDMKPEPPLPPLPEKKLFGSNEPAFIEKRRCEIESFIRAVIQNRFLLSDVDFLALVGFEQAKEAFIKEMSNTRPSRKVGGVDLPDETSLAPWYAAAPSINHDNDYAAAQGFIRGTGYGVDKLLPHMSYRHPRKSNALVSNSAHTDHILSIVCFSPNAIRLDDDKKFGYFTRFLTKNLDTPYVHTPVEVTCDSSRVYIVRGVAKYGSLRDKLYDASPLQPSTKKFKGKPKPFSDTDIATYGRQMLLAVKSLHVFNLCCPNAHLGNWMLQENGRIELSDIESTLLGVGRFPTTLPWSEEGEHDKTSMDILVVGINLIEMSLGAPLSVAREVALLSAQGDPTCTVEVERDEDKAKAAMDALMESLPSLNPDLLAIIKYIFHPVNKADIDVLMKHSFFSKGKFKGSIAELGSPGYEHPQLKLKNKDIEMFANSAAIWAKYLEAAEEKRLKMLEGKAALKELKKNKGKRVPTAPSAAPEQAPLQIAAPAPVVAPKNEAPPPSKGVAPPPSKGVPPPPSKGVPPPPSKGVPPPPSKGVPPPPSKGVPPPPSKGVPPPPSKGVPPPPSKGVPPPPSKGVPPAPPAGGPKKTGGPPGPPPPPPPKKMGGPPGPPPPPPPKRSS